MYSLTSITIPDSIKRIESYAFDGCSRLTSIIIPDSVTSIGNSAFQSCSKLAEVYITDIANWCSISFGNPYSNPLFYAKKIYLNDELVTDLVIPDGVTSIGYDAFRDCASFTSVTIPRSVTSIDSYAFHNCTNLTDVYYTGSKIDWNKITISTNNQSLLNATIYCADASSFSLNDDGKSYTFAGYDSSANGEIVIPSTYNGLPVTRIGENALYNCTGVTAIIIPDSVMSIGPSAFVGTAYYNDDSNWEDNVLYIGEYLIEAKTDLNGKYVIKDGTKLISDNAFYNCISLSSITIPESVTGIGAGAFNGCSAFKYVFYSGTESQWENIVFGDNNSQLKSAAIHHNATDHIYSSQWTIDEPATCISSGSKSRYCVDCDSRTDITEILPSEHTYGDYQYDFDCNFKYSFCIYCDNYYMTDIVPEDYLTFTLNADGNGYTVTDCVSEIEGSFVIPSTYNDLPITSIGSYAFEDCINLTSVTIPDGITSIGYSAFSGCSDLRYITIPDSVKSIGRYAFQNTSYYNNGNWEDDVLYIDNNLIEAKTTLTGEYSIKEGTKNIAEYAFYNCKNLSSVTIPDGVAMVSGRSFYNCTNLTEISIPDSVTSIGSDAFSNCTSLTSITIPDSVISIGNWAFSKCTGLTSIEIPDSVTSIGRYAFSQCTNLTSATIPDSVTNIYSGAFYMCSSLTSMVIPDSVTSIDDSTFYNCTSLSSITIPDSVRSISSYALYGCTSLKSVTLPDSVTSIAEHAFCNSGNLNSITIPDSVTSIGYNAFGGTAYYSRLSNWEDDVLYIDNHLIKAKTSKTGEYKIKEGTKTVANTAFYDCKNITTITIPESLTNIGREAFWHCYALTDVYYLGLLNDWDNITIGTYNDNLTKANISHLCTWGDWVVDSELGCTTDGVKSKACKVCNEIIFETTPATGHLNTEWITEEVPTCTEAGYKDEYCLDCGELINTESIPATGHVNVEWVTEQEPTCTESGYKNGYCLDCTELLLAEEIPATGHLNTEWITEQEPTCTEPGYKDEYCLDCGELINTQDITATGHSYGDWVIAIEPTCTESGSKYKTCSNCSNALTEVIEPNGHNHSDEWTIDIAPTCTEEGSKSHHCTVCGDKADVTVISATGHLNTEWITEQEPNCTEPGYKDEYCLDCGELIGTEEISALGHSYSTEWTIDVEPTCTEEGSKSHHCSVCGDKADVTAITPLGHNYEIVSSAEEHPHLTTYRCSRCPDTKEDVAYSENCALCNFTFTDIDDSTCKITGYTGNSTSFVIPDTLNGKTVATSTTGAFKNNTTLTSVEIEDGVQGLGSLAFLGCKSLSKIVIPESVTTIGTKAFYNCASDFTIYCFRDSYAMEYAIDNGHNYVIMDIGEASGTIIDYADKLIFTTSLCATNLEDIIYIPSTSQAFAEASVIQGNNEYLGTGSIITVFDNDDTLSEYTLIVNGDTNGDSVCDVLDCFQVERASNGNDELSGAYAMAADSNSDDVIDITDYQAIVNKAVS